MNDKTDNATSMQIPANVRLGRGVYVQGRKCFWRFFSRKNPALVLGDHTLADEAIFALGAEASLVVGECCRISNATFLIEGDSSIGNNVIFGWNVAVADTDFHPLDPAARMKEAVALSPLGNKADRPAKQSAAIHIEDDVWIGPSATILKGVRIGAGSFIEPGSIVTVNVPPRSRVMGNPARVIGEVWP